MLKKEGLNMLQEKIIKVKAEKMTELIKTEDDELKKIILKLQLEFNKKTNNGTKVEELKSSIKYLELATAIDSEEGVIDYCCTVLEKEKIQQLDLSNAKLNPEELLNYCNRVIKLGFYSRADYTIKAMLRILGLTDVLKNKSINALRLNKDVLNQDFSFRTRMIINTMRSLGTNEQPIVEESKGVRVLKRGLACREEYIVLFDFLIGQFVEAGSANVNLVLRADLLDSLNLPAEKDRLEFLKDGLETIGTQIIRIDDTNATDTVVKRINKNISETGRRNIRITGANLFTYKYVQAGDALAIEFSIPLIRYFIQSAQFGRYLDAGVMKYWRKNTRIYWIAKELAKLCNIKKDKSKKQLATNYALETFLKNINEHTRYVDYKDKKLFLKRLKADIIEAATYVKGAEFKLTNFTVANYKTARISII